MNAPDLARNRWPALLVHFGIDQNALDGKHHPCPACGGKDRFRFDDKEGRGSFYCSHCRAGDGFRLLELVKGWTFKEAADQIKAIAGTIQATTPTRRQSNTDKLAICRKIWKESQAVTTGDPVSLYLAGRGWSSEVPAVIRFHPRLSYRHDDNHVTYHPAMVSRVQDKSGRGCAIHRTYLSGDGQKANVQTAKKVAGNLPASSAIQLFEPSECLGIAEGIETALSAFLLFGVPTWAAVTAGGLERWAPPKETKHVMVFGDNDISGTGQAAAWSLAKRLITAGIETAVLIPKEIGSDWNDVLKQRAA